MTLAALVVAAILLAAALARGRPDFDPRTALPPWGHRCRVAIAAYEDGSASLYCAGRKRRFATIDAETGRIRMRMPWQERP